MIPPFTLDDEMFPPYLGEIFERVRQSADFMPITQVYTQMENELGINWRNNFINFNDKPFAAASIGQVIHSLLHFLLILFNFNLF